MIEKGLVIFRTKKQMRKLNLLKSILMKLMLSMSLDAGKFGRLPKSLWTYTKLKKTAWLSPAIEIYKANWNACTGCW
jgi:hypothetical protein